MNPPINHQSEDEDAEYESPVEDDPHALVSPNRPHQSPTASPRALLRPDPPRVEDVLRGVDQQLRDPNRQQRADRRALRKAEEEAAEAAAEAARAAAIMPNPPPVVDFDREDGQDGDKANDQARQIKFEFSANDIRFWFAQLEDEMTLASVCSQWLKKTVLQRNLPVKQKEDVKSLLTLTKTNAGQHIYLDIKNELIRIYAAKPQDSYRKALTRTMTGLPSQLGLQIVDDVCKKSIKMKDCCCAPAVLCLWSDKLPIGIRAHISNREFTCDTYKQVFEAADQVFLASRQAQVGVAAVSLDETLPAFSAQNQPSEVAAIAAKNKNNKNNGSGSGSNSGGGKNNRNNKNRNQKPRKKHDSVPDSIADKLCSRHYSHADQAWFCLAPLTCPWKDGCAPRT